MKKFLFLIPLLLFTSCSGNTSDNSVSADGLVDLTNIYAQVCESKTGPCKNMACNLQDLTYFCSESIANINKNCSVEKNLDDVITSYKICGEENPDNLKIFNYGQNIESISLADTPEELEQKIKEETEVVENGGTSEFLTTMLAAAGGTIIGGMISNALFNRNNAFPPKMPNSAYEQPLDRDSLQKTQEETSKNNEKIKKSTEATKKKSINNKKSTTKKTTKKSTKKSKKRR